MNEQPRRPLFTIPTATPSADESEGQFASPLILGPVHCAWCGYGRKRAGPSAQVLAMGWLTRELRQPPESIVIERDRHGRPYLSGISGVDVNWSHSGELLLVALGRGVQVGVDIELLRPRANALTLAARFFAPEEAAQLQALPEAEQERAFIHLWCAKEAVLKALGRGISYGLQRLAFVLDGEDWHLTQCDGPLGKPDDWTLHAFSPHPGYHAALAWRSYNSEL